MNVVLIEYVPDPAWPNHPWRLCDGLGPLIPLRYATKEMAEHSPALSYLRLVNRDPKLDTRRL